MKAVGNVPPPPLACGSPTSQERECPWNALPGLQSPCALVAPACVAQERVWLRNLQLAHLFRQLLQHRPGTVPPEAAQRVSALARALCQGCWRVPALARVLGWTGWRARQARRSALVASSAGFFGVGRQRVKALPGCCWSPTWQPSSILDAAWSFVGGLEGMAGVNTRVGAVAACVLVRGRCWRPWSATPCREPSRA